jgi:hypothetical protein
METNSHAFAELEELRKRLQAKMEALQEEFQEVKNQHQSVTTTLNLLGYKTGINLAPAEGAAVITGFNGLTQAQALERIAKNNGGRFKMKDAKRILVDAGLIKTAKNANNILYNVIQREEGKFRRVSPGEYELSTKREEKPLLAEAAHK